MFDDMKVRPIWFGILGMLVFAISCKDSSEKFNYTITGAITVRDNCGPSREFPNRDTLSKIVGIRYNIRHSDSAVLQGSTEVTLNEQGKAFYSITVQSAKKLKPTATWGIPVVKIDCPKFRCFADSIPMCTSRAIGEGMAVIPVAKDTVWKNLEFECYCAP